MNKYGIELVVGLFVSVGMAALAYLSITIGGVGGMQDDHYSLIARFENTSGLKTGAFIEVAGVRVGQVMDIELDPASYKSVVTLSVDKRVEMQEDAVASIRTSGIIGDKFIKLTPGGSDLILEPGEEVIETEPSISIEELVSKYIFNSDDKE